MRLATDCGRIREDTCGVDQGPALYTIFDPFLNVLVEPLEADGHCRPSHLVHHHIAHAGPVDAGNVERLAVPVPPVNRKADVADTGLAEGSHFPQHRIDGGECEGLQQSVPVAGAVEVLLGKPDMVVVLPEYGLRDGPLRRVRQIGGERLCRRRSSCRNGTSETVLNQSRKKGSAQLISGLRSP